MKKIRSIQLFLLTSILLINTNFSKAQEVKVFEEGDLSVNMGMSFGLIGYNYGYGSRSFPLPITANVEYGVNEYLGVGGYIGYLGMNYGTTGNEYKYRNYSFGVQGVFHATPILNEMLKLGIDESKIDYYAKLVLGFETYKFKYVGNNSIYNIYNLTPSNGTGAVFGPVLGARYLFNPNFGAYIEGGRGAFGWITLGISIKL
jgi:hypothetical protein